ncbi:hypothetical protein DFJ43DRAFT_808570 [Lentinula guzmanii]|uniref:Uncharacterized protein n=1 Tax=Lentinula guzmanii TaxID=2804957 RepID=A0AA38J3A9_9AGAR|nr:hypothetical protein DFJ43DRAFT_808570 [Lentinula guzmanii]
MQILSIYLGFILGFSLPCRLHLLVASRDSKTSARGLAMTSHPRNRHKLASQRNRSGTLTVPAEVSHRLANYFHEHESDILLDDPVNQIGYPPGTEWPAGRSNRAAVDFAWARSLDSPFTRVHLDAE